MTLVINRFAVHRLAQAQFFEQSNDFGGIFIRHGQVMRSQRASHAGHAVAAAVATGAVFQLQQLHVGRARAHQSACARQAGYACANHQNGGAVLHRWGRQIAAFEIAQTVAAS